MKGPSMWRGLVLTKHDLIVAVWDVERRMLGVHFDHCTMGIAAGCHVRALERPKRVTLTAHQFSQDLGDMARFAGRNRYMVDHRTSPTLQDFYAISTSRVESYHTCPCLDLPQPVSEG